MLFIIAQKSTMLIIDFFWQSTESNYFPWRLKQSNELVVLFRKPNKEFKQYRLGWLQLNPPIRIGSSLYKNKDQLFPLSSHQMTVSNQVKRDLLDQQPL